MTDDKKRGAGSTDEEIKPVASDLNEDQGQDVKVYEEDGGEIPRGFEQTNSDVDPMKEAEESDEAKKEDQSDSQADKLRLDEEI